MRKRAWAVFGTTTLVAVGCIRSGFETPPAASDASARSDSNIPDVSRDTGRADTGHDASEPDGTLDAGRTDAAARERNSDGAPIDAPANDTLLVDSGSGDGSAGCVGAPWWDHGYRYRQQLTITNNATSALPAGYTVAVAFESQGPIEVGKLRWDGADLRVVWWDGASTYDLDRRVIGLGTPSTMVWFKTQTGISVSDDAYYLYYGDPVAGSPPQYWSDGMGSAAEPSRVYLAADDFKNDAVNAMPGGWVGSTAYHVELDDDGVNHVMAVNATGTVGNYLYGGDLAWTDIYLESRIRMLDVRGTYYGLFARVNGEVNFEEISYTINNPARIGAWYCSAPSPTTLNSCFRAILEWTISDAGTAWHTLAMSFVGQQASFYYDGAILGSSMLQLDQSTHGRIGCDGAYGNVYGQYDDYTVRLYVDPEPTVVAGAEQPICP